MALRVIKNTRGFTPYIPNSSLNVNNTYFLSQLYLVAMTEYDIIRV